MNKNIFNIFIRWIHYIIKKLLSFSSQNILIFIMNISEPSAMLIDSCKHGFKNIVELILVNETKLVHEEITKSPLHTAIVHNQVEITKLILDKHMLNINSMACDENTGQDFSPLSLAIRFGNHKMMELVLNYTGVKIYNINLCSECLIRNTGHEGNWRDNLLILSRHKSFDAWNFENSSHVLLMEAVEHGRVDIVNQLFRFPKLKVNGVVNNLSPLLKACIATDSKTLEILKLLISHPSIDLNLHVLSHTGPMDALSLACQLGNIEAIKLLLACPIINVNSSQNSFKYTPLMWAISIHNPDIVQILSQHKKVDFDLTNSEGKRAIDMANFFGLKAIAKMVTPQSISS